MSTTPKPPAEAVAPTPPQVSSSSSITESVPYQDVEAQDGPKVNYFRLIYDQVGLTHEALHYTYPGGGTPETPYIVDFLPSDAWNPTTLTKGKKWSIVLANAIACLALTFGSSAYTGGLMEIMVEFEVSQTVSILGISLYVLGFALGPLLWAPLSEIWGRQYILFVSTGGLTACLAGSGASDNIETLLVLRFFAGAFGSSTLTNSAGIISDMFDTAERGAAGAIFAVAPFLGPALGPIAGGFLGAEADWRWVQGMMAIFAGVGFIMCLLICPETFAPYILSRRAKALGHATGNYYVSRYDLVQKDDKLKTLMRPWVLLIREPIVLLSSLYIAVVYGTLYMLFAAFPYVYQLERGWSAGVGGLAFIGVSVGMVFAAGYFAKDNKRYAEVVRRHNGAAQPESRLPPGIIGSILLPIGLFWFAWTCGPDIHWAVSMIASAVFGCGIVLVFLSLFAYLMDSYAIYSASALAANSVVRSLFGAAFPLFTKQMYDELGIHWASSVPAFMSILCLPFPFLFWKYGRAIRLKCKYAAEAAAILDQMSNGAPAKTVNSPNSNASDNDDADEEEERRREKNSRHDSNVPMMQSAVAPATDDDSRTVSESPDMGRGEDIEMRRIDEDIGSAR